MVSPRLSYHNNNSRFSASGTCNAVTAWVQVGGIWLRRDFPWIIYLPRFHIQLWNIPFYIYIEFALRCFSCQMRSGHFIVLYFSCSVLAKVIIVEKPPVFPNNKTKRIISLWIIIKLSLQLSSVQCQPLFRHFKVKESWTKETWFLLHSTVSEIHLLDWHLILSHVV